MQDRDDERARGPGRHPFPRGGAGLLAAKIRPAGALGPRVRCGSQAADSLNTLSAKRSRRTSHGADVGFGHPCLGKGWAQSNKRRGETNGRWCPQILRAGDRSSGAPCRRSRRRKRQGHPEGRDCPLADSPCSWCRALCACGKWIPDTTRQRRCKSGQGASVRLARRPNGPCPPSCADVVQSEVNIEFEQWEASPHHELRCTENHFRTVS
jgi:hypothetical protein